MPQTEYNQNILNGKIIELQGNFAIIELEDGQKIHWLKKYPISDSTLGSTVYLKIMTVDDETLENEKIAKILLNQLLKIE